MNENKNNSLFQFKLFSITNNCEKINSFYTVGIVCFGLMFSHRIPESCQNAQETKSALLTLDNAKVDKQMNLFLLDKYVLFSHKLTHWICFVKLRATLWIHSIGAFYDAHGDDDIAFYCGTASGIMQCTRDSSLKRIVCVLIISIKINLRRISSSACPRGSFAYVARWSVNYAWDLRRRKETFLGVRLNCWYKNGLRSSGLHVQM